MGGTHTAFCSSSEVLGLDLTTVKRDRDLKDEELSLKSKEMAQMKETLEEVEGE